MAEERHLCRNCMEPLLGGEVCLKCGHEESRPQIPQALPYETVLQGRYLIGKVKKQGTQGFTYIGYDRTLGNKIAVREFFPKSLCHRDSQGVQVMTNEACYDLYCQYREEFLQYVRTVARMRELHAIDQIYDIFEENGTAYTVSDWEEQVSLRFFVEKSGGTLDWNAARKLFMPVLSTLSAMHEQGVGHYGISPDALSIMEDGRMKLGDYCIEAVRREGGRLPADLVPGCAALEQYSPMRPLDETTDVYGFCAALFYALTGFVPERAIKRKGDARLLIPTGILKEVPPHVVTSLANGLQVYPQARTQTFKRLRAELSASPTITAVIEETQSIPKLSEDELRRRKATAHLREPDKKRLLPVWIGIPVAVAAVIGAVIVIAYLFNATGEAPEHHESESSVYWSETESETLQEGTYSGQNRSSVNQGSMTAPDLTGLSYTAVQERVLRQQLDYEVISRYEFHEQVAQGLIISQTPKAGEHMERGDTIVVVVSKGPGQRTLPAVAGMEYSAAVRLLTEQGFEVSCVFAYHAGVADGCVVGYQNQQAGDVLQYGAKLVLDVSRHGG